MGFEISPSPVRTTRLRWPAIAFAAALVLVVVAAVANEVPTPQPSPTPAAAAAASEPLGAPQTPPAATPAAAHPRTLPSTVQCRQLEASTCRGIAQAAIDVLPTDAPPVTNVTVYRSLLCRNDFDCPPGRLASSGAPSGSVVLGFADGGPDAWVDVVTRVGTQTPGASSTTDDLEAWIIR